VKLIFAGTPEFAARALSALFAAGHEIALVLTQPDRAAGRGLKVNPRARSSAWPTRIESRSHSLRR